MADRIEVIDVTVPAGTLQSAPITQDLTFDPGVVEQIEFYIPPGPSGFMGFHVGHSGEQVIPRTSGTFIIADNDTIRWPLTDFPTGAAWFVTAYNTDTFDHFFQIRLLVSETERIALTSVAVLPIIQAAPSEVE